MILRGNLLVCHLRVVGVLLVDVLHRQGRDRGDLTRKTNVNNTNSELYFPQKNPYFTCTALSTSMASSVPAAGAAPAAAGSTSMASSSPPSSAFGPVSWELRRPSRLWKNISKNKSNFPEKKKSNKDGCSKL